MRKVLFIILCFGFAGCGTTGIIKVSPDTYMISKERWGFSTIGIKAEVFKQANDFASSQGKVMMPVAFKEQPVAFGRYPTVELQFRVLDKDDPKLTSTHLENELDVVKTKAASKCAGVVGGPEWTACMGLK